MLAKRAIWVRHRAIALGGAAGPAWGGGADRRHGLPKDYRPSDGGGGRRYVLGLKDNHPTLGVEAELGLDTEVGRGRLTVTETVEKDHGRIKIRRYALNDRIDWLGHPAGWGRASGGPVKSNFFTKFCSDNVYGISVLRLNRQPWCSVMSTQPEPINLALQFHGLRRHGLGDGGKPVGLRCILLRH